VIIYKKRSRTLKLQIDDPDDEWGDLLDAKLWLSVKVHVDDDDADAVISKRSLNNGGADSQAKVTVGTGTTKEVEFYFSPGDTAALDYGAYVVDAVIELPLPSMAKLQLLEPVRFAVVRPATLT